MIKIRDSSDEPSRIFTYEDTIHYGKCEVNNMDFNLLSLKIRLRYKICLKIDNIICEFYLLNKLFLYCLGDILYRLLNTRQK